ncbi:MAG: hypothetical protein HY820_41130 [Acidobacteria bacterium]|nr:hypothetical protein [Acidobacteriota bacterium]
MIRGFLGLFLFALLAPADALDEAARALGRKVAARVPVADAVRVTDRNLSSLSSSEAVRARVTFERSLRRALRNPPAQEITVTLSETAREFLLVAEIVKGETKTVEMVAFRSQAANGETKAATVLARRMIWEQEAPLLDVVETSEGVLVADTAGVALYARQADRWERLRFWTSPLIGRDPRATLSVEGGTVKLNAPDRTCTGQWRPAIALECAPSAGDNNAFRFNGWPPYFSLASLSNGATVLAETDGRAHLYDAARKSLAVWTGFGSDLLTVCGTRILATSDRERDKPDTLRVFDIVEAKATPASAPLDLPGPVLSLRAAPGGAVAVVRDLGTQKYAAYHVAVDCAR